MPMKYCLFAVIFSILMTDAFGQKGAYKLHQTTFDFGEIHNWNNQAAKFQLTNTGKFDIVFLPTFPKTDLFVELPQGPVKPGSSSEIEIYYYTSSTGEFKRSIDLYIGTSPAPIQLTIKGNILSLHENALVECPGFAPKTDQNLAFEQQLMIIDAESKNPIQEATVWISSAGNELKTETRENGISKETILPGLYGIMVEKQGYQSTSETKYISKQTGLVTIELEPIEIILPLNVWMDDTQEIQEDSVEKEDVAESNVNPLPQSIHDTDINRTTDHLETDDFGLHVEVPVEDQITEPVEIQPDVIRQIFEDPQPATTATIQPEVEVLPITTYNPNNIVFLIDVSTSMKNPDKLPLLKSSMKKLTEVLRDIDQITIVTYSSSASVAMTTTNADNKQQILLLIDSLSASGWTHGVKGIETAYELIESNFITGGNNQIILATDGLFNNPDYSQKDLFSLVEDKASEHIILSVIGFGKDNDAIKLMKRLAGRGQGSFIQIESVSAANEALIEEIKLHSLKSE